MSLAETERPTAKDPVCGMTVDPKTAKQRAEHGGKTYYFCSARCRERFVAEPERYLASASTAEPHAHDHAHHHSVGGREGGGEGVKDPVCGMTVDPKTAKHQAEHGGKTYYFCSAGCRERFVAEPERYLASASTAEPHAHDHAHHHAASDREGGGEGVKDPVCGMTVDPKTAKHQAEHGGKTYYFCSARCRERFVAEPERYLASASTAEPHAHYHAHHHSAGAREGGGEGVKDPVCGRTVDPATAKYRAEHGGKTYYFCSAGCQDKFVSDPARYLGPKPAPARAPAGTIYTCPMHPEIRQEGPGFCPICGMALEPEVATAETGPSPELVDMKRRFWIGLALAIPVVVLEMGGHFAGLHRFIGQQASNWIQFVLATPVVLWRSEEHTSELQSPLNL